jgi:hypothetical protein
VIPFLVALTGCQTTGEPVARFQETIILEHVAPEEICPLMEDLMTDRGSPVVLASRDKALLITGTREQITEAKDLAAQLDRPLTKDPPRMFSHLSKELHETLKKFLDDEKKREDEERAKKGEQRREFTQRNYRRN